MKRKHIERVGAVMTTLCLSMGIMAEKFVRVNQIGYDVDMPKVATVSSLDATYFEIKDAKTGESVYRGNMSPSRYWEQSREKVQKADFSDFKKQGNYYMQVGDDLSYTFQIGEKKELFTELASSVIRAFYYWRASTAIEPPYSMFRGTDYSRQMAHPDTMVFIHRTAASEARRTESVVSSPGGWYDAGDYNKYVVNAGITLHQMMMSYEMFPAYYQSLSLNIPRTSDLSCDFLCEMKWEYDWLFTMQDPADGGVYHKVTTLDFCDFIMPEKDNGDRYMAAKSTAATLDFAAVMAMCARVFQKEDPNYAKKALNAAEKAWKWAEKHPNEVYYNPEDILTGAYGDNELSDEFFWAASELFITTKEKKYYEKLNFFQRFDSPEWRIVNTLGLLSLRLHSNELPNFVDKTQIDNKMKGVAISMLNSFKHSAGRVAINQYSWGSNGVIASNGALLGFAYYLYKDPSYREAMVANFDYLLGSNPTDYCFITCYGKKYPRHLHDRRTYSDNIIEPIPGYLCGGSTASQTSDCGRTNYPSVAPARCYLDNICSYTTNEVAINWNAPLVLLVAMVMNL